MKINGQVFYKLIGADGKPYFSGKKGEYGGYNGGKGSKIYGLMDCPSALRWIAKGFYVDKRVFFANEYDAIMAGFRPCAVCQKEKYLEWKKNPEIFKQKIIIKNKNSLEFDK
jgi:hypothetical protein